METATFSAIETIVHQGKAVVSSEDSAIIDWAMKTTAEGRTATLYLKPIVYEAIRRRTGHRSASRLLDSNLFQRK
jgi:hypothetical protein